MNLSENTKRFFSILGLISCLYLLTYIQHLLDPATWHYNTLMTLTSFISGLVWLWLFITALRFSNDLFDWNLERFAVCSCEDVEWVEDLSDLDKNLPALVKVYKDKQYYYTIAYSICEKENLYDYDRYSLQLNIADTTAYIPLSHLTNEDEE